MAGRGAWNSKGVGGTLSVKGDGPGMFYRLPATGTNYIGKVVDVTKPDERAVKGAVKAYQAALNRRLNKSLLVDGVLGPVTSQAIVEFQTARGEYVDGVIGPKTSKALLFDDLVKVTGQYQRAYPGHAMITPAIICGVITQESGWDAGAVGYVDDQDLGLAQINGPSHSQYTEAQRLDPLLAFAFVFIYLRNAIDTVKLVTIDDAIASYNLGTGGAGKWIDAGRPNLWDPTGRKPTDPLYKPRDVRKYIDTIKTACA